MKHIDKLLHFIKPYWRQGIASLALLIGVVLFGRAIRRGKGNLILEVQDDGNGIAPEALPRIYERSY